MSDIKKWRKLLEIKFDIRSSQYFILGEGWSERVRYIYKGSKYTETFSASNRVSFSTGIFE
jgi:hypothetical protein